MSSVLHFDYVHEYDAGKSGISVPIALQSNGRSVDVTAKLDTGASACVFSRQVGEAVGIEIEQGWPSGFVTATGQFQTYQHGVTLGIFDYSFEVFAYFAEDDAFSLNILGRNGFVERLNLGLVDYEGKLFFSKYDE